MRIRHISWPIAMRRASNSRLRRKTTRGTGARTF
jgi:hypothetical protein